MHARFAGSLVLAAVVLGGTFLQVGIAQVPIAPRPAMQVEVTGDPAPIETLRLAILTTARGVVPDAMSGQLSLSETAPPLQPLPAASEMALRAFVQVVPSGAKPVTHTVPVDIKNEVLPWADAQALLVSNSPETLPFGKVLLNEAVLAGQTVRLLYHHSNGSPTQRMTIAVNLSNPDRGAIALWVTGAASSSGADELTLGHAAARAFLDQYWHHAGFMVRVPGNTTLPLFLHDLPPGAIASGLTQLTLIDGDHVNVQVFARMEGEMDPPTMSYAPNFDKVHQRGSFDRPQFVHPMTYTVGGPLVMMSVGDDQDALRQSETNTALSGNYGVIYTFPVEVINPSPLPTILGLVMQAVGGQAGGTILIDDHIVDVPRVRSGERRLVSTIHVPAGKHRTVIISTMPESGANYPVRFTFGSQYQ